MDKDLEKHVKKTGTLTVGIVCKDGIVLAADNRITYGGDGGVSYIANQREKISKITDNSIVTIAGVASDADKTIRQIRAEIRLKELK
jgi:proteasome beta subunit